MLITFHLLGRSVQCLPWPGHKGTWLLQIWGLKHLSRFSCYFKICALLKMMLWGQVLQLFCILLLRVIIWGHFDGQKRSADPQLRSYIGRCAIWTVHFLPPSALRAPIVTKNSVFCAFLAAIFSMKWLITQVQLAGEFGVNSSCPGHYMYMPIKTTEFGCGSWFSLLF